MELALTRMPRQLSELCAHLGTVDPAVVAPYLGRYEHPMQCEVEVALRDGELMVNAGEVRSEMRPRLDKNGQVVGYVFVDPLLTGPTPVTVRQSDDGRSEVVVEVPEGGPTTYVFTFVRTGPIATPTS